MGADSFPSSPFPTTERALLSSVRVCDRTRWLCCCRAEKDTDAMLSDARRLRMSGVVPSENEAVLPRRVRPRTLMSSTSTYV